MCSKVWPQDEPNAESVFLIPVMLCEILATYQLPHNVAKAYGSSKDWRPMWHFPYLSSWKSGLAQGCNDPPQRCKIWSLGWSGTKSQYHNSNKLHWIDGLIQCRKCISVGFFVSRHFTRFYLPLMTSTSTLGSCFILMMLIFMLKILFLF